ncbi:hypothetical protein KFE98_20520 [bacterium SCSIO 12741]|nr:hypothetical protein KFE98_20520 [bacterium SCSIO 12741]
MKRLPADWLTSKWVDFEYKQYQLLAYLQQVEKAFDGNQLYPPLEDLKQHHGQLQNLIEAQKLIQQGFSADLTGIDLQKQELNFHISEQETTTLKEFNQITEYALPKLQHALDNGNERLAEVKNDLQMEPIGLQPLYLREGYLLLQPGNHSDVHIYRYRVRPVELKGEPFHNLQTWFLRSEVRSLSKSLRQIKLDLIKQFKNLPNPATWFFQHKQDLPLTQTLLPVSRHFLWKKVIEG